MINNFIANLDATYIRGLTINHILTSQKILHTSPSQANYGVSIVRICEKIDHVITHPHCISAGNFIRVPAMFIFPKPKFDFHFAFPLQESSVDTQVTVSSVPDHGGGGKASINSLMPVFFVPEYQAIFCI